MTTARLGFPLSPCNATTTLSPRRGSRGHPRHRRSPAPRMRFRPGPGRFSRLSRATRIGVGIPRRNGGRVCRGPRFELDAVRRCASCLGVVWLVRRRIAWPLVTCSGPRRCRPDCSTRIPWLAMVTHFREIQALRSVRRTSLIAFRSTFVSPF